MYSGDKTSCPRYTTFATSEVRDGRAFRGHIHVSQCLMMQIIAKVIDDESDFEIFMTELERLYTQAKVGYLDLDALLKTASKGIHRFWLQRNLNYRNIQKRANCG